ncbi:MFS transporter [Alicyclobacillus macrosporangiidus]|uniref:MFS transporter n=1 Tax=Alicyclobacillus macrosporangiidus TaxID=392015 RepID=UPI0026EA5ACF|nr:MFS transporter [Alicyclobacillus macrosporangiidus]
MIVEAARGTFDAQVVAKAIEHLVDKYSTRGARVGWLMIASIFVESWDLYSISFVLIFIQQAFHPSTWMLGLAAAATQGGAVIGSLAGGWLTDRVGRRAVFLGTMITFFVFGTAQGFVTSMTQLVIIRFILGIPLGTDIANGYTYIMEYMQRGKREVMGNRWQFMFAVGEVVAIAFVLLFLGLGLPQNTIWRVMLGLSGLPALVLFILRMNLPETVIWLIHRGQFREAKKIAQDMYGDPLDMLPDENLDLPRPKLSAFLSEIRRDPLRWRATLYGWIACFAQSSEFSTFAFYLPVLFLLLHVSGVFQTDLISLFLYLIAVISGWVGPLITPRIGQRKLAIYGFSIVFVSLIVAAIAIYTNTLVLLPFVAAAMLWGHYWDAENVMTIPSMVAPSQYRGTATGFAYVFVKLPSFLSIFLFPSFFNAIGKGNATLFTALFPLLGLLAAIFILPEVYGYKGQEKASV